MSNPRDGGPDLDAQTDARPPELPRRFGDFEILREIGRGGMGTVYEARQLSLDRSVALKVLPREAAADPDRIRRFEREARALAAIEHPNIVAVHSVERVGGLPFLTMELVRGRPLSALIPASGMAVAPLLDLAVQLAEALTAAGRQGIVHRDLKPANIMVTDGGRAKILDFGLATLKPRAAAPDPAQSQVPTASLETSGPQILGTLPYMSPEQIEGKPVDTRSDLFSLGVVLYEMAAGRRPFTGDTWASLASSILRDGPRPLNETRPSLPGELGRIVGRCLQKDPERRYQTAADLRNELEDLKKLLGESAQRRSARRRTAVAVAAAVVLVAVAAGLWVRLAKTRAGPSRQSVVVLPFNNLGPAEDEYFAGGLTEEVTSRLAALSGLSIRSSATAQRYDAKGKSSRDIGRELGVAYILYGTVRWDREGEPHGRVRITPKLVRVADDTEVWSAAFDRILQDVFSIQSEIAETVAARLGVELRMAERATLARRPTDNPEAYLAYLRGRYYESQPHFSVEVWRQALASYQRAVELDPGFALAFAQLAKAHARLYYLREDLSEARRASARQALERARTIAPDAPEVHLAAGFYHAWAERDPDAALKEFTLAGRALPDSAEVASAKAELLRMQGRYEEALAGYRAALELSPQDSDLAEESSITCWWTRRYPEALEYANRAITLAPDQAWPYLAKAFNYWSWKGTVPEARAALEFVSKDHEWWLWAWFWQEAGEGRYREALRRLDESPEDWIRQKMWAMPKALFVGLAHRWLNEPGPARAAFERAARMLEAELAAHPDDPRLHSSLGLAYAELGRKAEAIREGRRGTELLPIEKDAVYGLGHVQDLASIYAIIGETDAALREIEHLLSIPSWISPAWIRGIPLWKGVWGNPRLDPLLAKYR